MREVVCITAPPKWERRKKKVINNAEFNLKRGDVIQLDPEKVGNPAFAACFLVVDEVKKWGVQGYVTVPGKGQAYYRPTWDEMDYVGQATWIIRDATEEELNDSGSR